MRRKSCCSGVLRPPSPSLLILDSGLRCKYSCSLRKPTCKSTRTEVCCILLRACVSRADRQGDLSPRCVHVHSRVSRYNPNATAAYYRLNASNATQISCRCPQHTVRPVRIAGRCFYNTSVGYHHLGHLIPCCVILARILDSWTPRPGGGAMLSSLML